MMHGPERKGRMHLTSEWPWSLPNVIGQGAYPEKTSSFFCVQRKGICRKDHPRMCERESAVSGTGAERCTGVSP